jgi:hypothetical protein
MAVWGLSEGEGRRRRNVDDGKNEKEKRIT